METFRYQEQPISSPPPSWGEGGGEPSSDPRHQQQPRERGRGGRRGAGVRLSTDPQSMAARERRHRISERFRILKGLVPGGSKMDTVSMLEEAIHYVKFLKSQIWLHQAAMMLPSDEPHPPPFPSSGYDAGDPPPHQSVLCYCMPPPPSPLPPFPCSSFHGEN